RKRGVWRCIGSVSRIRAEPCAGNYIDITMRNHPRFWSNLQIRELYSVAAHRIERGKPMQTKLIVGLFALLLASSVFAQPDLREPVDTNLWQTAPRTSPFQAVKWDNLVPQVQVKGTWYELVALND